MERRKIEPTGFPDTDRERLQKVYDQDAKAREIEEFAKIRERRRRAAQQAGLQKRRLQMEETLQEEQDELARNHQVGMMINLIKENATPSQIRIDVNSVSARSLAKAMRVNNTITCLDISSNQLNDHAGSYLARILARNKSLKKVELDNNHLGPKALLAFGESLKTNTTLEYLSLESNPVFSIVDNFKGAKAISEALRVNRSLTSLNLWKTGMKEKDGEFIAEALDFNNSILFLDIGHNSVKMKEMKLIADKLDRNLAAFETNERIRRDAELTDEEKRMKIQEQNDVSCYLSIIIDS